MFHTRTQGTASSVIRPVRSCIPPLVQAKMNDQLKTLASVEKYPPNTDTAMTVARPENG